MSSSVPEPPLALPADPDGSAPGVASPTGPGPAVAWALGLGLLATAGLAVLTWAVLALDAIAFGIARGFAPESVTPPDELRYATALATGACVTLIGGPLLAWRAARGRGRTWGAALVGIGAGVLAAVAGTSALLLVLGTDPITFFLGG